MIRERIISTFKKSNNELNQIILINVLVFLLLIFLKIAFTLIGQSAIYIDVYHQFAIPASLDQLLRKPWTLITYFFTHAGLRAGDTFSSFFHIAFNMLALYWFGNLLVNLLGSKRLLSLYLLGGISGGLFFVLLYNLIPYFEADLNRSWMVGASASVYAIIIATATQSPNYTFYLVFLGPVRIKYIAAFCIFVSFIGTIGSNAGGNMAHLGGALIGFIYVKSLQAGTDIGKPLILIIKGIKSLFQPRAKMKITYVKSKKVKKEKETKQTSSKKTDQSDIDQILDKISVSGYQSLSKEEKQKLFDASRK